MKPPYTATLPALGSGLVLVLVLLAISCTNGEAGEADTDTADESGDSLQVFAAASLSDSFNEIGDLFEDEYGAEVSFNFAGSSDLVAQIEQGAPADVFASADEANMDRALDGDLTADEPKLFVANTLVIATPPDNPAAVDDLADMAREEVVSVVCAPQVPCGGATTEVTDAADVELDPASEENAVTDVLGKVTSGEADAGLVYRTDALGAGDDVEMIEFDGADDVVNNYPIVTLEDAPEPQLAEDFVEFILSPEPQEIFSEAGFSSP